MKKRMAKGVMGIVAVLIGINLSFAMSGRQDLNADKIARALAERLKRLTRPYIAALLLDSNHCDNELRLIIDTRKQQAYFTAMGHELFRMRAKYVDLSPTGISIADNWLELQGNRQEKIYLDIAKKILFFKKKDGSPPEIFAHVEIEPPLSFHTRHVLVIRLLDHQPIEFYIFTKYKKAYVSSHNRLLFVMHAKKIKIRGSSVPIIQLKYMNRYKDGIYLNPDRKILYFRSGRKGVFAKVKIAYNAKFVGDNGWGINWDKVPD